MLAVRFSDSIPLVERVGGKFTLFVVDHATNLEVEIPLSAEGADSLRDDLAQVVDTPTDVLRAVAECVVPEATAA